ncbi:MAG: hypothetical protein LBP89_02415 [Helicobacteraceae bacterium]|jgi:hypothetical protein|nr:hypothetical protein [Helicobacteraceae bacterium]
MILSNLDDASDKKTISIAVLCDSPLLTKALERMLKARLAPLSRCDLAIGDKPLKIDKPLLIVGDHLPKPFSRENLYAAIARFEKLWDIKEASVQLLGAKNIKEKIDDLTNRYAKELLELTSRK